MPLLYRYVSYLTVVFEKETEICSWDCYRWNILRNPQLLRRAVTMVYADRSAVDEKLVQNMKAATDHPAAFAAFASIMFAPQAHTNFKENLIRLLLYNLSIRSLVKLLLSRLHLTYKTIDHSL